MKQKIKWLAKAIIAGVLAFSVACAVCLIYYNPGIHITNETGATDYRWLSNSFTGTMIEGIAWHKTDRNGFYNGSSAPDKKMNILVMGSSHMEGTNIPYEQSAPRILSELTGLTVYNIGTSGHGLLTNVKNLENALSVMQPTDYVIIETVSTTFFEEDIEKCLSGEMEALPSYDSGLLFELQKFPYFKLMYSQLKRWRAGNTSSEDSGSAQAPAEENITLSSYRNLASHIHEICEKHGVKPIIFYHPSLSLNPDGSATVYKDNDTALKLQEVCENNNIIFIDMSDDFLKMYEEEKVLPNGFCNTAVGFGHLNKYGHRAIAERLSAVIKNDRSEGDKKQ